MTPDEIRAAVEADFRLNAVFMGWDYAAERPAGVDLIGLAYDFTRTVNGSPRRFAADHFEAMDAETFGAEWAGRASAVLIGQAIRAGATSFEPITVDHRPGASIPSQGGRGAIRSRPRAFIVRAMGWSTAPKPEYVHVPTWFLKHPDRKGAPQ